MLATDLDEWRFEPGDTDVVFLCHDVASDPLPEGRFDLVHARFLLEHLPDPQLAIRRLRDSLRPGGVIVLEDSAGLRVKVTPASPRFDLLAPAWEAAGRKAGWDATYGRSLVSDLRAAGLADVRGHEYRQLAPGGDNWAHVAIGLAHLRNELIEQGISKAEVERAIGSLADSDVMIAGPPVVVAWGRAS